MRLFSLRLGIWLMLLLNLVLLIEYLWKPETASLIVIIFWIQSILLGVETILKILFTPSGQALNINGEDKITSFTFNLFTAGFFTVHFGVFILVMGGISLVFLKDLSGMKLTSGYAYPAFFLILTGVVLELPRKLKGIRRNSPGIVTLMFAPYIRLVPLGIILLGKDNLSMTAIIILFIVAKFFAEWLYYYSVDRHLFAATESN